MRDRAYSVRVIDRQPAARDTHHPPATTRPAPGVTDGALAAVAPRPTRPWSHRARTRPLPRPATGGRRGAAHRLQHHRPHRRGARARHPHDHRRHPHTHVERDRASDGGTAPNGTPSAPAAVATAPTGPAGAWTGPSVIQAPLQSGHVVVAVGIGDGQHTGNNNNLSAVTVVVRGVEATTGRVLWAHPLPPFTDNSRPTQGVPPVYMAADPTGAGTLVVLAYDETHPQPGALTVPDTPTLLALDTTTGTVAWTVTGKGAIPMAVDRRTVLVALTDDSHGASSKARGLDTATGKTLWDASLDGDLHLTTGRVVGTGGPATALDEQTGRPAWTFAAAGGEDVLGVLPAGVVCGQTAGGPGLDGTYTVVLRDPATGKVTARSTDIGKGGFRPDRTFTDPATGIVVLEGAKGPDVPGVLALTTPDLHVAWTVPGSQIPDMTTYQITPTRTFVLSNGGQTVLDDRTGKALPVPTDNPPALLVDGYEIRTDVGTMTGKPSS